jgi:hypothetical protein
MKTNLKENDVLKEKHVPRPFPCKVACAFSKVLKVKPFEALMVCTMSLDPEIDIAVASE